MDLRNLSAPNKKFIVAKRYVINKRLGGGSFGQLYSAYDKCKNRIVAIKLEKTSLDAQPTLKREYSALCDLSNQKGFPIAYDYGKELHFDYIIMNILGSNLDKLFNFCNKRFSLKTVLMLTDQMVKRIEILHSKNYLHRDIKPENFCIGSHGNAQALHLIDFGLSKAYMEDGNHCIYKENKGLVGTARYASINTHKGIEQSRRDDLESIGYLMVYFLKGRLPWQDVNAATKQEKYQKIKDMKINIPLESLCDGLPYEIFEFIRYARNLNYLDMPDYKYLRKLCTSLMMKDGYRYDFKYDWMDKRLQTESRSNLTTNNSREALKYKGTLELLENNSETDDSTIPDEKIDKSSIRVNRSLLFNQMSMSVLNNTQKIFSTSMCYFDKENLNDTGKCPLFTESFVSTKAKSPKLMNEYSSKSFYASLHERNPTYRNII